jgi:ABC-type multidrug transport system ATPase subunit
MLGKSFHSLSFLCESLEKAAITGQLQSVTFRSPDRQLVGSLMLDGALVRFGVHVEGRPYTDAALLHPPASALHGPLLAKLLARTPLTGVERQRLLAAPLLVRRAQRDLTARALRKLAALCDPSQLRIFTVGPSRQDSAGALHHAFRPVELLLAAGSSGNIRYTDPAARYYELPPPLAEERWLFEWQTGEPSWPWPILAPGLADRTSEAVAQLSQIGNRLAEYLHFIQSRSERRGVSAAIFSSEDHSYYVISTRVYLTLLVYPAAQHDSLLQSIQSLTARSSPSLHGERPEPEAAPALGAASAAELAPEIRAPHTPLCKSDLQGSDQILKVEALTAWLGDRLILRELNLRLGARGVYALLGATGSGKSSLLGILAGRNRSGSGWMLRGKIFYQGIGLGSAARPAVVGPQLGCPDIKLRDYLLGDASLEPADAYPQLIEQLERVGLLVLGEHLDQVLGQGELRLSRGQWWRLALARELLADPPLLCLDEPTAELDAEEAALLLLVLRGIGRTRTVLLATRDEQQARDCGDYLIRLVRGHIDQHEPIWRGAAQEPPNPPVRASADRS